ncbi:SmORF protein [Babesia bovis T2Bo]|uniref:SmORF n=1 Tax=Babesia bovis TaxID=5865 RepID=A7AXD3_BABBO|nr:SmORF protein [Babesia bovis T2Bo]EDO05206.1 SmORF protein [Babesia bovis T2Bo]|eukprot:XP_001608774.1 SmORF [Babesia bovis T2Bo]
MKTVSINKLSKLCALVALGLPSIATSTDVAQEQPKKESFLGRFFGKKPEAATKRVEVQEKENSDSEEDIETGEPSNYSVEWYLLPKPLNRAILRYLLPSSLAKKVPEDCNEPIDSLVENEIRKHFIWYGFDWYLLTLPQNRSALRKKLPRDGAKMLPES